MKMCLSQYRSTPFETSWENFDVTTVKDKPISFLTINCSKIENPESDVEKIKQLSSLKITNDCIIASQDIRVLKYLALATKNIIPADKLKIFYLGKNEEELNEYLTDFSKLGYHILIPIESAMWMPLNVLEKVNLYPGIGSDITNKWATLKGVRSQSVRDKLDEIIDELLNKAPKAGVELNDLDKIVYVSNYIQSHFQFVEGIISNVKGDQFEINKEEFIKRNIIPDSEGKTNESADFVNLLEWGWGHCQAFSTLTMLLLNNPKMNVNCRLSRTGYNWHVFNLLVQNGKQYVIDNAWCITRNPHRHKSYLRAKAFSDCFLLVGEETIKGVDHHNHAKDGELEDKDYSRDEIQKSIEKLKSIGIVFEYQDSKPRIPQELKKEIDI